VRGKSAPAGSAVGCPGDGEQAAKRVISNAEAASSRAVPAFIPLLEIIDLKLVPP